MNKEINLLVTHKPQPPRYGIGLKGRAKLFVIDEHGNTVKEGPWIDNLILDRGLNNLETVLIADLFKYCVIGTGVQVTRRTGTGANISMTNGSATITGGAFTAADVGRLVRWTSGADSGYEATIASFTDATHVEAVEPAPQNIAAGTYTVHYVEQVSLAIEIKRTGEYSTGGAQNGTTTVGAVRKMKRTFLFSAEVAPVTYEEIGFSHEITGGENLNIRINLDGGFEIAVAANQRLKVTYELTVTVSPSTIQSGVVVITDSDLMSTNKNASWVIEKFATSLIDLNGNTDITNIDLEPSFAGHTGFSSDTGALVPLTGASQRNNNVSSVELFPEGSYVAGSFERAFVGTFDLEDANRTDLRSLMLYQFDTGYAVFTILFNNNQAKDSDHALTVRFLKTWGRDLS